MENGTRGIGALVVPHVAFSQTRVPHAVEDIRVARLSEYQHGGVGLHCGDEVFVLSGDIQQLYLFQVHPGILGKILEPGQDMGICEQMVFHISMPPLVVCSSSEQSIYPDCTTDGPACHPLTGRKQGEKKVRDRHMPSRTFFHAPQWPPQPWEAQPPWCA